MCFHANEVSEVKDRYVTYNVCPSHHVVLHGLHTSGCTEWVSSVAGREQLDAALGALRAEVSFETGTL